MKPTTKEKQLIDVALLDLWKSNSVEPLEPSLIDEALSLWETEDLLQFLDDITGQQSNEFTIEHDRASRWIVTHLGHEERSKRLKTSLYTMLQHHLQEGKVAKAYLKGIDKKYLDFYSPTYGEPQQEEEETE